MRYHGDLLEHLGCPYAGYNLLFIRTSRSLSAVILDIRFKEMVCSFQTTNEFITIVIHEEKTVGSNKYQEQQNNKTHFGNYGDHQNPPHSIYIYAQ